MRRVVLAGLAACMVFAVGVWAVRLVVTAAGPAISEGVAAKLALHKVAQEHPELKGFVVVRTHYEPVPWTVRDSRGMMQFSESKSGCPFLMVQLPSWFCPPGAVWAVELTAPPQGQWVHYEGFFLVDAKTGVIRSESFGSSN
jgi:hypothetical protein